MMERELNKLSKADLIAILVGKSVDGRRVDDAVRVFFENLFETSCEKCKLEKGVAAESDDLICAVRRLEQRLETVESELDTKFRGERFEGQCQIDGDVKKMGIKTSTSEMCDLAQIETDLKQFHDFCLENNLTEEEISKICQPLTEAIRKDKLKKIAIYSTLFFVTLGFLYSLSYIEIVDWHYSAMARIFLIKILPIWDWQHLKSSKCLIGPSSQQPTLVDSTCTFCEFIDKMDVTDAFNVDLIDAKYVKLHRPVIVENAMENWFVHNVTLIEDVLNDSVLSGSFPCKFSSNAFHGHGSVDEAFRNINDQDVYFYHFQNCEFEAVKSFRKFVGRPGFLAAELAPIQYSWLLISDRYKVERFKQLNLTDSVAVVGQIAGKNIFRLHPVNCEEECSTLRVDLITGEALIFSQFWSLDYKPDPEGENIAVILETH